MSQNIQYNGYPLDPNTAYLPVPQPGLSPPPGVPFQNAHPPMPMGPPSAILVDNISEILKPVHEELQWVATAVTSMSMVTHDTNKTVHELSERVKVLEVAAKQPDSGDGSEGDDEGPGGMQGEERRPKKRARPSKEVSSNGPTKGQRSAMFLIVRKVLYSGCAVDDMKGFQEGLTGDELIKRVEEDPAMPWRPNFRLPAKHNDNKFWVDEKIIPNALSHPDATAALASGDIPKEFWTKEFLRDDIVKGIWESARKALRINMDPEKKEDALNKQAKANTRSRKTRLFQARFKLATDKDTAFQAVINKKSQSIPKQLLVPEVMSDVVSEKFGAGRIPKGVTLDKYDKHRDKFKYEGVTPFYRNQIWNDVFKEIDNELSKQQASVQPRYYATTEFRGKRNEDGEKVTEIPVRALYCCHLDKVWYDRLPESMKKLVKPSPSGWEVDEELNQMEAEATGH